MSAKLTKPQRKALNDLLAIGLANLPRTKHGNVSTGVHTMTLHGLVKAGYLTMTHIYIGGIASPDLAFTEKAMSYAWNTDVMEEVARG